MPSLEAAARSLKVELIFAPVQSSKRPRRERKPLDQYWRSAEELAEDQNRKAFLGYASPKCIRCPIPALICREWSEGLFSSLDVRLLASADGLADLEVLKLGWPR